MSATLLAALRGRKKELDQNWQRCTQESKRIRDANQGCDIWPPESLELDRFAKNAKVNAAQIQRIIEARYKLSAVFEKSQDSHLKFICAVEWLITLSIGIINQNRLRNGEMLHGIHSIIRP